MAFKPTPEQDEIVDGAKTGIRMKIKAGAGSGKTSTLKLIANAMPDTNFLFVAYGRAIKEDAEKSFPRNVTCLTSHGVAYRAVGAGRFRRRINAPRQNSREVARILAIREPIWVKQTLAPLAPQQTARIVIETLKRFCYSADTEINQRNVPRQPGLEDKADHEALAAAIVPIAKNAWADIKDEQYGLLRYDHDYYLKQWALSGQQLDNYNVILLDEAQDSNACVADAVMRQEAMVIPVGDSAQAIYGWRGATDALSAFEGREFLLSQSFRFGQGIADEANKWLTAMPDETLRITGFDQITSIITDLSIEQANAVICRTNAGTIKKAIEAFDAGLRPALVGGAQQIKNLALAAIDLKSGRPTSHPELYPFTSWQMVQDYVEHDGSGSDMRSFVALVDSIGAEAILDVTDQLADERYAKLKIMTGHKAKGLEFDNVLISDDFREPAGNDKDAEPKLSREDAMLAYVGITRGKKRVDRGSLNFIDKFGPGGRLKPEFRNMTRAERESITISEVAAIVRADTVECGFPLCIGHTEEEIEAGKGCITETDLAMAELDGETIAEVAKFAEAIVLEEEAHAAADAAKSIVRPGATRHLLATSTPKPVRPTLVTVVPAPRSTCTCGPAEAKRYADLIGQPAGPDVDHCYRCGGGRSMA